MMAAVAVAVAVLAVVVQAADVTGKWTGQVPTRDGGTREATFNFKQDGEKLTGTMTGPQGDIELKDGAVKGDDVGFNVALSFGGNDVKLIYKGARSPAAKSSSRVRAKARTRNRNSRSSALKWLSRRGWRGWRGWLAEAPPGQLPALNRTGSACATFRERAHGAADGERDRDDRRFTAAPTDGRSGRFNRMTSIAGMSLKRGTR